MSDALTALFLILMWIEGICVGWMWNDIYRRWKMRKQAKQEYENLSQDFFNHVSYKQIKNMTDRMTPFDRVGL